MSVYAHLDALNEKHRQLSKRIKLAYRDHAPDESVNALKKKRLRVEEEMEHYYSMASTPRKIAM